MRKFFVIILLFFSWLAKSQEFPQRKYYDTSFLIKALESYHSDSIIKLYPGGIKPDINVTSSVRKKLLSLLKREWTIQELEPIIKRHFRKNFEPLFLKRILDESMKYKNIEKLVYDSVYKYTFTKQLAELQKDSSTKAIADPIASTRAKDEAKRVSAQYSVLYDSIYRKLYDSAALEFRLAKKQELKEASVPDEIVLLASVANLFEAVPILKQDINADKHYFNSEAAELALAGLGDTSTISKFIANHLVYVKRDEWIGEEMLKDITALGLLIGTQESFSFLSDWMDTSRYYVRFSEPKFISPRKLQSAGLMPIILASLKNKNFIDEYRKLNPSNQPIDYYDDNHVTKEHVLFVKNWLISNKGRYEFW